MVFKYKPSLGVPIQQLNNVRNFQHRQPDVILFTKSVPALLAKYNEHFTNGVKEPHSFWS